MSLIARHGLAQGGKSLAPEGTGSAASVLAVEGPRQQRRLLTITIRGASLNMPLDAMTKELGKKYDVVAGPGSKDKTVVASTGDAAAGQAPVDKTGAEGTDDAAADSATTDKKLVGSIVVTRKKEAKAEGAPAKVEVPQSIATISLSDEGAEGWKITALCEDASAEGEVRAAFTAILGGCLTINPTLGGFSMNTTSINVE